MLEDFDELQEKGNQVYSNIGATLNAVTIIDNYPAIFEWVKLFDNNVWFIIAIMVVIAGINMITALLVLILERVQMVGILKTLGSSNWEIQKVFLYTASYLAILGLIFGNGIGLLVLFVQKYWHPISLDPSVYYVTSAPIHIDFGYIIGLNLMTFSICFLVLIIPSYLITKINPVQAIKFN